MHPIIEKLKQRKLVQWGVAYLAGAVALYSALDAFAEPWGVGDLQLRIAQVGLLVGFFIALTLAWYHGERGEQRVTGVELLILAGIMGLGAIGIRLVTVGPMSVTERDGSGSLVVGSEVRFDITLPEAERVALEYRNPIAVSPDGLHVAIIGSQAGGTTLYLRTLSDAEVRPLSGARGATDAFFSPDSEWLGFVRDGKLYRVSVRGGAPIVIGDLPHGGFVGASWAEDDHVVVAPGVGGLLKIPVAGGAPAALTEVDGEQGEFAHTFPQVVPELELVLFTVRAAHGSSLAVVPLTGGTVRYVRESSVSAMYRSGGVLLRPAGGALIAEPFDLTDLESRGAARSVLDDIVVRTARAVDVGFFDLSETGTLAYLDGRYGERLVWYDEARGITEAAGEERGFWYLALSPDERRIAATIAAPETQDEDLWLLDIGPNGTRSLFATDGDNITPAWTPDGNRIAFASNRDGDFDLFWQDVDQTEEAVALLKRPYSQFLGSWLPDGSALVFGEELPETGRDIWLLRLDEPEPVPLVVGPGNQEHASVSPDGRWLAYASDETGRSEIYVTALTTQGPHDVLTADGGSQPKWSRSGDRLYYRRGSEMRVMTLHESDDRLAREADEPIQVAVGWPESWTQGYDVTHDGRLLFPAGTEFREVSVILGWVGGAPEVQRDG